VSGIVLPEDVAAERWIRLERSLRAPNERVFRVWSDPEELPRWLPDKLEGSLAVGSRSTLLWRRQRIWWDVTAAEPNHRFAVKMPWLPDGGVVTTFEVALEPEGYGTRLRFENGPFRIDEPGVFEAWERALEAWVEALAMLRAFVDFSTDLRLQRY
jgi:uncharacterized protein YndB with AHSA1/START domain